MGKTNYINLTDENFRTEVIESRETMLVLIAAEWSGACHIMKLIIEELIDHKEQIKVGKLDIDFNEKMAKEYGVGELPILLFFKNGQMKDHVIGTVPKKEITVKIKDLLGTQ